MLKNAIKRWSEANELTQRFAIVSAAVIAVAIVTGGVILAFHYEWVTVLYAAFMFYYQIKINVGEQWQQSKTANDKNEH